LELAPQDAGGLNELILKYVQGIVWCYYYYYRGCVSWKWFYPYHYSPLASDLTAATLKSLHITFDLGTPFQPFQQLLAVLPKASSSLLPPTHAALMLPGASSISDSYPDTFQTDMDGKNWEWEAVVMIPFINETLLFEETARVDTSSLSPQQLDRNRHGLNKRYVYDPQGPPTKVLEASPMGSALPPLQVCVYNYTGVCVCVHV